MRPKKNEYGDPSVGDYFDEIRDGAGGASDEFVKSLDTISAEELKGESSGHNSGRKKKNRSGALIASRLLLVVSVSVLVFCLYKIGVAVKGYIEANDTYDFIADEFLDAVGGADHVYVENLLSSVTEDPMNDFSEIAVNGAKQYTPGDTQKKQYSNRFLSIRSQIDRRIATNPDTFGYIYVDSTRIKYYPVVQANDNSFYLKHDADKNPQSSGAIFVDYRNNRVVEKNRNLVIYGHNMESGAMFHGLLNYLNEQFFMEKDIMLYTLDGIYTFTVFSVYQTKATGDYFRVHFYGNDDFISFCVREEQNSMFHKPGIEFTKDSVILTLSTCINGVEDGRYAIHGLLTKVEY